MEEAKLFHQYCETHKQKDFFDESTYYILSKKWFDRWKVYVGYDQVNSDQPVDKVFPHINLVFWSRTFAGPE